MDCGTSMVNHILLFFNTLCSICGILLIVFGALLLNNIGDYDNFGDAVSHQLIPIGLIVFGSVVLLISFLGYCGAIRESYCMSMTYSVAMLVLLLLQVAGVVYFWVDKESFANSMGKIVDKAWDERTSRVDFMDALQVGFKCCGKSGPTDYLTSFALPPATCCAKNDCSVPSNIYMTGCRTKMVQFWSGKSDIIKFAGLFVVGIELIGIVFGCWLANNIRTYKRISTY